MRFIWDEAKRESNLRKHGLDFADAYRVFEGVVVQQPTRGFIMANTVGLPWACLTPPLQWLFTWKQTKQSALFQ